SASRLSHAVAAIGRRGRPAPAAPRGAQCGALVQRADRRPVHAPLGARGAQRDRVECRLRPRRRSRNTFLQRCPVARLRNGARANLPSARATSAGGIVIRRTEQGQELVLGKRRRERDGVTWSLPKGTPHRAETIEQTALREVIEETGLEVRILAPVGPIQYFF